MADMKIHNYLSQYEVPDVIEPTVKAIEEYGCGYGAELTYLSDEHIEALRSGKLLAFHDGEYSHFMILGELPND